MSLEETLERINREGSFGASILAGSDGLPIATAPSGYDTEITAAMVALLRSVARETQDQVGMAHLDEVSVLASDRVRLVCRYFNVDDEDFILAVVVPPHRCHRRLTNRAIREIRRAWQSLIGS